jgi:L-alanine-DL-glutamate epimerase-like enolase superfamily enzyme
MADESCFDEFDAERLIALNACDLINVKLGKSSGLYKARRIVQLAEEAGLGLQAGGFLESRLGFTAIAHLALSSKQFLHYDFDTPLMFREDPVVGGIAYGENGIVRIPEAHGLGAEISEETLKGLDCLVVA